MNRSSLYSVFLFSLWGMSGYAQPAGKTMGERHFKNPVIARDFPDPTVIRVGKKYYCYATQGQIDNKLLHIQVAGSDDLQHWKIEGDALPVTAAWAAKDFWAPQVLYDEQLKKFVLFYSAESADTTIGKCIGVAFSSSPLGPFTDKGSPLICGEGFVNIDPMAFIDPKSGKRFLYWGSGFQPIRVQEMNEGWTGFASDSQAKPIVWPDKNAGYAKLVEGAWLDYNDGQYYLYYSGDNCCGGNAHYAVMVAKADNPLGPFKTLGEQNGTGNSVILEKDSEWNAPGHNSIFRDEKGNIFIAYHAIPLTGENKGQQRVLCIRTVEYADGWPRISKN
jgi:arabinan endo-1,5-alpha-L-arabinosidase